MSQFSVASDFPSHRTVLPLRTVPIPCIIAEKALKLPFCRKSEVEIWRKHAQSTFRTRLPIRLIVIGGLRGLLLPFLMWAGPDFENFAQSWQSAVFAFFPCLITRYRKIGKSRETISGSLVVGWVLYWYSLKLLLYYIYFADRWRCKCAVRTLLRKHVQVGKFEHSSLPHRTS